MRVLTLSAALTLCPELAGATTIDFDVEIATAEEHSHVPGPLGKSRRCPISGR
jgi:hypothetical protein